MTTRPELRVLFFDVFGTCVAQIPPVADALSKAAQESLSSDASSIQEEIRKQASNMTQEQWSEIATEWNNGESDFRRQQIAKTGTVDWKAVDEDRIQRLPGLLSKHGLITLHEDDDTTNSETQVSSAIAADGFLFNDAQLTQLGTTWHRLPTWPDTVAGLHLLNQKYTTVGLSNTYQTLLESLVAHSKIPFKHVVTAEQFNSYKPKAEVYLGAAERMGVRPEQCALVAAHLGDLKGAKACGFYAVYVERPGEEKNDELRGQGIPDLVVEEGDGGFVTLAERLGIRHDE